MCENKSCSECGFNLTKHPLLNFETNKYGHTICGDCGIKSHCFCDECSEYVPTSECVVHDLVTDSGRSYGIEETKVLCDGCNWESE